MSHENIHFQKGKVKHMELKFVIPNVEKTFGSLEFAGGRHGEDTGTFHLSFHVSYQDKDTELLAKSSAGINIVE